MTTNQTIDGVLREQLVRWEELLRTPPGRQELLEELRALLDAPSSDANAWRLDPSKRCPQCVGHGTYLDGEECGSCGGTGRPPAQPQGEPVAWLAQAIGQDGEVYRNAARTTEITLRDVSFAWGQGVIDRFTVVIKPLYAEQPAPVAVVLPDHRDSSLDNPNYSHARGWNACLDEVIRLNSARPVHAKPPPGAEPSGTHPHNDGLDEMRKP